MYSVKMRAAREKEHISGAEKLMKEEDISTCVSYMVHRGMNHPKGKPDFLNIKIEEIKEEEILKLEALPVTTHMVETSAQGLQLAAEFLSEMGIDRVSDIMEMMKATYGKRGAMLLDVDRMVPLEPDLERGIRATYMDCQDSVKTFDNQPKNHYNEAIVLATKVANTPGILGEFCISDDPDYVTGYVASKELGYRRITKLKEKGDENGGRIFLFRGTEGEAVQAIQFLEKQPVLVNGVRTLTQEEKADTEAIEEPVHCMENEDKWQFVRDTLEMLEEKHLYRTMKTISSEQTNTVTCNGREMLMLASNHYLDMANVPEVKEAAIRAIQNYGTGSGGSRLTTGNNVLHMELEAELADWKKTEAALLFNTGYVANLAVISSMLDKDCVVFSDELNHASIIDGCRLSKAKIVVYKHNDMKDLEAKMQQYSGKRRMAVSDAVFSMDGDILNLPEFIELGEKYQVLTMIDEAHSTGVLGATGAGITEYYGNKYKPDILMGTLSKSLGSEGGFVCGSKIFIEYLKNKARGFIFSTSQAPSTVAAACEAIRYLRKHPEMSQNLRDNVNYFCEKLTENGISIESETAIVPIVIGEEQKAMDISQALAEEGIYLSAIRYPTVAKGSARLRAAIMASHSKEQLLFAAERIAYYMKS